MDPELRFMIEEAGCDAVVISRLRASGLTTLDDFAAVEDTAVAVRALLKALLEPTPANDIRLALQIGKLVAVWTSAHQRVAEAVRTKAIARAHGDVVDMPRAAYLQLMQVFQAKREDGRAKDSELPARAMVESILEQLEEGELRAEKMTAIISRQQEE